MPPTSNNHWAFSNHDLQQAAISRFRNLHYCVHILLQLTHTLMKMSSFLILILLSFCHLLTLFVEFHYFQLNLPNPQSCYAI